MYYFIIICHIIIEVITLKVGRRCKFQNIYDDRSNKSIAYALEKIRESDISIYVKKIYLYGSCARKEQKFNSDVDLFMELSDNFDIEKYRNTIIILKGSVSPLDSALPEVDLKVVIGNSWMNNDMLYYQNIRKEGINLWGME